MMKNKIENNYFKCKCGLYGITNREEVFCSCKKKMKRITEEEFNEHVLEEERNN